MTMRRAWAMPCADTFAIPPIREFVTRWLDGCVVVVDPFARDSTFGTWTNDLNPSIAATYHMEARDFLDLLLANGIRADGVLFDPPYSPRQISEVYQAVGREVGAEGTQNARLYRETRDRLDALLAPGGVALSFGWNSAGMGKGRGYTVEELLLVAHGGAHNDTICVAERKAH